MKTTALLTLLGTVLVGLTQPILAVPRDGGGSRGSFGDGHVAGGLTGGGARLSGGSTRMPTRAPQQFYYYSGHGASRLTQHALVRKTPNRSSVGSRATKGATISEQQNRAGSLAKQNRRVANSNGSGSMAGQNTWVANSQTASAARFSSLPCRNLIPIPQP